MLQKLTLLICICFVVGCSSMMNSATNQLADNLAAAILNQNDPETVREGAPAYLLLIDSLIEGNPQDPSRLATGARLYSAYASIFVTDEKCAKLMAAKALDYARRALCLKNEPLCRSYDKSYEEFLPQLALTSSDDITTLYVFGASWATWIKSSGDDWSSIANLPKIKSMMQRITELQDDYDHGGAHLYLGVIASQLPPSLGGKPEQARSHFERAIELSQGKNLMARVLFARHYARLLYKRELHDRLLNEVLVAEPTAPGFTLMNILAKQQATELLDSAKDYF